MAGARSGPLPYPVVGVDQAMISPVSGSASSGAAWFCSAAAVARRRPADSHLHQKSGSAARPSDFALDLRRIAARQSLPGYSLQIELEDGRELLRFLPEKQFTVPVDNHVNPIGTLGARSIGILGANRAPDSIEESSLTVSAGVKNAPSATRDHLASDRMRSQRTTTIQSQQPFNLPWVSSATLEDTP